VETNTRSEMTRTPTVAHLRHRAEVPMLMLAGLLTAAGMVVAVVVGATGAQVPGWAQAAVLGIVGTGLAALVLIRFNYWRQIANSVEITGRQFPEIHQIYQELLDQMELDPSPRLYVGNGNGVLNAYAAKCQVRRSYVVIFSDLVDVAYELGDFNAVRFVLAHELGHIKCGHVDLWRLAISAVPRVLFLNRSLVRAQEYTADRCAAYYAPEGAMGLMVLFAGKRLYPRVNPDAYFDSVQNHRDGFWLRAANFWSNHAVGFRRMEPLRRLAAEGWDVHGKML